jgi:hypothetical protein
MSSEDPPFRTRASKQTTKRKDTDIVRTSRELHPVTQDALLSEKVNPVHEETPHQRPSTCIYIIIF